MAETKAKRRLSDFDFSKTGAHVALVHKEQGGAASGYDTLILKSAANFSEEVIEKMQRISVEYELPDFLATVFGMYWGDAQVLARLMGYVEEEVEDSDYRDWIEERLESFTIMKSLHEAESLAEAMSKLDGESYLSLLKDQERVEKALKNKASLDSENVAKATEQPLVATKPKARVVNKATANAKAVVPAEPKKVAVAAKNEVKKMTDKVTVVQQTIETEMVSKSQFDEIQKAFEAQKEAIEKANALIAQFEAEKKAAIAKARKSALVEAVEKEEDAEVLFKAFGEIEEESFTAAVGVLKALAAKVEKSEMFKEVGVSVEGDGVKPASSEDELTQLLKARYSK